MRFRDVSIVGCFAACSETLLFAKYFRLSPKPTPLRFPFFASRRKAKFGRVRQALGSNRLAAETKEASLP